MSGIGHQHGFVSGSRPKASTLRAQQVDTGLYKDLFRVAILHGYNDDTKGRCAGFTITPSPSSADMMRSHGMVFHSDEAGFSVYIRDRQIDSFVEYLRRQGREIDGTVQYWTWLSFVLVPVNPFFVGITSLPIDTNPLYVNLYGANSNAHEAGPLTLLTSTPAMNASDRVEVTSAQFAVPVPGPLDQVQVADISGHVVLTLPTDADIAEKRAAIGGLDATQATPTSPTYVQMDLSSLPLGLYTFKILSKLPIEMPTRTLLYTSAPSNPPLVFLDMLFSEPYAGMGGIYPVPPLYDGAPISSDDVGQVNYVLRFDTRQTTWQYYVVSQTKGSELIDLKISGGEVGFTRKPDRIVLPSGQIATLLQSDATLAMREISPQRLTLTGLRRDAGGKISRIRVDPLPVAPIAPVWPAVKGNLEAPPPDVRGTSEMFVYV